MFYAEPGYHQRGRGVFNVDRYPLQRGRGLGGIFASLLRKVLPYWRSFVRTAAESGKRFIKSDLGKEIIADTMDSAANAAVSALLNENPQEAKQIMKKQVVSHLISASLPPLPLPQLQVRIHGMR